MIPVILSGGSGTRLWPLSRPMFPKQFLPLTSDNTMFQETLLRIQNVATAAPIIVANNNHRFMVAENIRDLGCDTSTILLEEEGRNTAPAIAVAALMALKQDRDSLLIILPADHIIQNKLAFEKACEEAKIWANQGHLVTFGIKPDCPNTNYGYIEYGDALGDQAFQLKNFQEKPDQATAEDYLKSHKHLWNSGIFMFKASSYLEELEIHSPNIYRYAKETLEHSVKDMDFVRLPSEYFNLCDDMSIDYAVMEHTKKAVVVPLDAEWCDVGSWDALWSVLPKDDNGNVIQGDIDISESQNSYVHSQDRFVSIIGVDDLIIADTKDALLVAHKDKVKNVKQVVESLKKNNRSEGAHHRIIYRPWGHFDLVSEGPRDKVKRLNVLPGQRLSLQIHEHRAEHWIVVKGIATVVKGDDEYTLNENESIYIPPKTKHSLANNTDSPLEIIEVQTGEIIVENDIQRLEDLYGR